MILTKSQARAVYDAMCALNNVDGHLSCRFQDDVLGVISITEDCVGIVIKASRDGHEEYFDQHAFAAVYDIK